jgi:hypothetical protein
MNVITTSSRGRKRQMVLLPEINPRSFLFFFERGATGFSYSLRDYSIPNHVTERRARDFGWTADQVRRKATHILDAPYMDVNLLGEWHFYTRALNASLGIGSTDSAILAPSALVTQESSPGTFPSAFPSLNPDGFAALPKSAKRGDVRRMLESPQSEDWVTWNVMNLLLRSRPETTWWAQLSAQIMQANPNLQFPASTMQPQVRFWQRVASPKKYEASSRERMRRSPDPMISARSSATEPVEGDSEIDLIIESSALLIYIEAKLDSDISMRTTHDPARNQIIRNIDCLLESARGRTPFFWMFVRDASQGRAYTQLMQKYCEDPTTLSRDLPHRDPLLLEKVAQGLTIVTWREIARGICAPCATDDEQLVSIKRELRRRIQ